MTHDEWLNRGNPADYDYDSKKDDLKEDLSRDIDNLIHIYQEYGLEEYEVIETIKERL